MEEVLSKFLIDRESLTVEEYEFLIELLKSDVNARKELRGQLIMDEKLSQAMSIDRQNFLSQIRQRIYDLQHSIDRKIVVFPQGVVQSERRQPGSREIQPSKAKYGLLLLAACLAVTLGVHFFGLFKAPSLTPEGTVATASYATIRVTQGENFIQRGEKKIAAKPQVVLRQGDILDVKGSLSFAYADLTFVDIASNTFLELKGDANSASKKIHLQKGQLTAAVTPQPSPMILTTAYAEARVLGTRLVLTAEPKFSRLEVEEGHVQFTRAEDQASVNVGSGSYALAGRGLPLELKPITIEKTVLTTGSAWKYWDAGTDLGTAWRDLSYKDDLWKVGPSPLGYDDKDNSVYATVLKAWPQGQYVATYFRHKFTYDFPTPPLNASLQLRRDDGAVVYLNGKEIIRSNMPKTGEIQFNTLARKRLGSGSGESGFKEYAFDANLLVQGENIFAVEVHPAEMGNTDLGFDLELKIIARDPAMSPLVSK
jgi:hypothetical protein